MDAFLANPVSFAMSVAIANLKITTQLVTQACNLTTSWTFTPITLSKQPIFLVAALLAPAFTNDTRILLGRTSSLYDNGTYTVGLRQLELGTSIDIATLRQTGNDTMQIKILFTIFYND